MTNIPLFYVVRPDMFDYANMLIRSSGTMPSKGKKGENLLNIQVFEARKNKWADNIRKTSLTVRNEILLKCAC
jgi:hypothetical protein